MKTLVVGGARSGKSRFAESLALEQDKKHVYIATALAGDEEMEQRIDVHRRRRGDQWQLIEEPKEISQRLSSVDSANHVILIDCLTLWLSNTFMQDDFNEIKREFVVTLQTLQSDVILVSNEVGSGIVPMGNLSRQFVDQAGWLNQSVAEVCDRVVLVVAGLPLELKPSVPC